MKFNIKIKKEIKTIYTVGDKRIIRRFLWVPTILSIKNLIDSNCVQTRWLSFENIEQEYKECYIIEAFKIRISADWFDVCWAD